MDYTKIETQSLLKDLDIITIQRNKGIISPHLYNIISESILKELSRRGHFNNSKKYEDCKKAWDDAMSIL